MTNKERQRNTNREKYKAKQKKKRIIKSRREALTISRENRKYIRKKVAPYFEAFRELKDKHLLFVLKDTDNMEKVLLQKHDLGKGNILLTLPVINAEMINEYLEDNSEEKASTKDLSTSSNEALKGIVKYYYSVESDEITDSPQMTVFRNCRLTAKERDLVELNVRPYDLNRWYNNEATTLNGFKIFKGNKLRTFFRTKEDLGKTYVFYDTVMELLLYKAMMGKIDSKELLLDNSMLSRKGNWFSGLYMVLATDNKETYKRFHREQQENNELDER